MKFVLFTLGTKWMNTSFWEKTEKESEIRKFDLNTDVDNNDICDNFLCSISQEIMQDPVIASDGFPYDRKSIEKWLRNSEKSPMTLLRLEHKNLIPNRSLKSAIESWKDDMKRK